MAARKRYELSDEQWVLIEGLFPKSKGRGRPWGDHRKIVNGLFWILSSGAPWRDLPERYGPWETVYYRFWLWDQDGTFDKIVETLQVALDEQGFIDWKLWCVDGSSIRAHKAAAGAAKKGVPRKSPKTMPWADPEGVGDPNSIWSLTGEECLLLQRYLRDNPMKQPTLKKS